MATLSDIIEEYIKTLLQNTGGYTLEIRRSELAERFACVPSQINYVLTTRFNIQRGYLVESRRGEGGFIKITRVHLRDKEDLLRLLHRELHYPISEGKALGIIERLREDGWISGRMMRLMQAAVLNENFPLSPSLKDAVRSSVLRRMIMEILKD
jgi:transcriptional regulator CtsR